MAKAKSPHIGGNKSYKKGGNRTPAQKKATRKKK